MDTKDKPQTSAPYLTSATPHGDTVQDLIEALQCLDPGLRLKSVPHEILRTSDGRVHFIHER